MNKTSYKQPRKLHTQNNFRKRTAQSPMRSQKSFEEQNVKSEQLKMEMLLNRQYRKYENIQLLLQQIGVFMIVKINRWLE